MRYVMYTEKSVPQAMNALNERLHAPGSKSRPQLDGWVDKSGRFSIGVTSSVFGRLTRKTYLQGKAERLGGITLIQGSVPGGVSKTGLAVIFGALLLLAALAYSQGNAILAGVAVLAGIALYIPLAGDYQNCETLLAELQKAVNARFTPPNGKGAAASAAPKKTAARPSTVKPASKTSASSKSTPKTASKSTGKARKTTA